MQIALPVWKYTPVGPPVPIVKNSADFATPVKDKDATKHFPAEGEGTLSGVIVETHTETGLAKKVTRVIDGGSLAK